MNYKNILAKLLTLALCTSGTIFGDHTCRTKHCERRQARRDAEEVKPCTRNCHHKNCKNRIAGTNKCERKCHTNHCMKRYGQNTAK